MLSQTQCHYPMYNQEYVHSPSPGLTAPERETAQSLIRAYFHF